MSLPTPNQNGLIATNNQLGFMHQGNAIIDAFLEFSPKAPGLVVDIGAAFGVATLPLINKGVAVTAIDMDASHLKHLSQEVPVANSDLLTCVHGCFPEETDFKPGSVGAVLLSHVLHFLEPKRMDSAFRSLRECLAPGGRVFIVTYTPYLGCLQSFIPVYEKRLAASERWPSWVENNLSEHLVAPEQVCQQLPDTMNYLDKPTLENALNEYDFSILQNDYLDASRDHIPERLIHDGREWCGAIATIA